MAKKIEQVVSGIEGDDTTIPEDLPVEVKVDDRDRWGTAEAKSDAKWSANEKHRQRVEGLGREKLVELREKGEIGLDELTPEQTKELIKKLGDETFHKIKAAEALEEQSEIDERNRNAQKAQERENRVRQIEDNNPLNKVKKFFTTLFTGRER